MHSGSKGGRRADRPRRRGTACQYREARRALGPGREAVPGMGLRYLASWAGAAGPGVASSPGEQAGRVRGRWQWQLAGPTTRRMCRMPSACPSTSPSGSKCLAGGKSRQAAPGRPLTAAALNEGQALAWAGRSSQDYAFAMPQGTVCPIWASEGESPRVPTSQGFREASGRRTKGPAG